MTASSTIYNLPLHDALPIFEPQCAFMMRKGKLMAKYGSKAKREVQRAMHKAKRGKLHSGKAKKPVKSRKQAIAIGLSKDRKSTRLNSSHLGISYAVFCLKKK